MKIGFIGLGKMGGNMTARIVAAGHEVHAYDSHQDARDAAANAGVHVHATTTELVESVGDPAIVWLMVPSEVVDTVLDDLLPMLPEGSILIDGGNSDFRRTKARAIRCADMGIALVDVGTSGGILGATQGYAMMIGGDNDAIAMLTPIFDALAPPHGWNHFGAHGSGHYVKMVHNAIEYGMMESYAEGYRLLQEGPYKNLDLAAAGDVWQHGSIVQSLLNGLTQEALAENPQLQGIEGVVQESGETRWALEVAKEYHIETPAIDAAFDVRLRSQTGETNYATKLLAAMRNKFGGHAINVAPAKDTQQ